jgi:hypothetical protein
MNSIVIILIAIVAWFAYAMYRSYTSMERELREIRMKCIGTSNSAFEKDPATSMRSDVVSLLSRLAKLSSAA